VGTAADVERPAGEAEAAAGSAIKRTSQFYHDNNNTTLHTLHITPVREKLI